MIYILGKEYIYEGSDMDDVIIMASTKIDKILEYAYIKLSINSLNDYEILIKEDGSDIREYDVISLASYSYDSFVKYKPLIFQREENEEEYKLVCDHLKAWCSAIEDKKKKIKEEAERIAEERKEKQERELYEKLKAKYGD